MTDTAMTGTAMTGTAVPHLDLDPFDRVYLDELSDFVAVPSISRDASRDTMQTAAQWLADRLAFAAGRVVPTKGHPVVRAPAYTIPASHPAIRAATAALEAIYPGRPVLLTCMGGTRPATDLFERVLGAKTLFFSFSTADENLHAPNEFMRIRRLREGYAPGRCSGG